MRRAISLITLCFIIISVFSGCGLLQRLGLQEGDSDEVTPVSSIAIGEDEAKKLTDKVPVHLYFANEDNTKLKLEIRYIPVSEAKKSVNNLAGKIVEELIKGPSEGSALKSTIPKEAKLASPVKINAESSTATVDFNKEFISKHPGGKDAERITIYSIVNSLTELKEIEKVKFTIDGKAQKEFKGNFRFDSAFPRTASLISKEVPSSGIVDYEEAIQNEDIMLEHEVGNMEAGDATSPENEQKDKKSGEVYQEEDGYSDEMFNEFSGDLDENGEIME